MDSGQSHPTTKPPPRLAVVFCWREIILFTPSSPLLVCVHLVCCQCISPAFAANSLTFMALRFLSNRPQSGSRRLIRRVIVGIVGIINHNWRLASSRPRSFGPPPRHLRAKCKQPSDPRVQTRIVQKWQRKRTLADMCACKHGQDGGGRETSRHDCARANMDKNQTVATWSRRWRT